MNARVQDLNKEVRSINVKTILKTTLVFVAFSLALFGLFFGTYALAEIAFPIVTWNLKAVIVEAITIGIGASGVFLAMESFFNSLSKTHKEFNTKMVGELKKIGRKNSSDINCSLFGYSGEAESEFKRVKSIPLSSHGFFLNKIELDTYATVEQRFIEIQRGNVRRDQAARIPEEEYRRFREDQDRSIYSTIVSMWSGSTSACPARRT